MKRGLLAGLAVLGPALVVIVSLLLASRPGLPAEAQPALTAYLAARTGAVSGLRPAGRPAAFTEDLSAGAYSDDTSYFAVRPAGGLAGADGHILPYPPDEAWCADLTPAPAGRANVIVIAKHLDLYKAVWVVHELRPASAAAALTRLGCSREP